MPTLKELVDDRSIKKTKTVMIGIRLDRELFDSAKVFMEKHNLTWSYILHQGLSHVAMIELEKLRKK